jgi:hypothetical protein
MPADNKKKKRLGTENSAHCLFPEADKQCPLARIVPNFALS